MASPLGGILEGFLSAEQLKRQRDRDLADAAIQKANMEFRQQEFDLDRRKVATAEENTRIDNERMQKLATSLVDSRLDASARGHAALGLRAQAQADAMQRFAAELDAKRRKALTDTAEEYRRRGYSPEKSMEFAYGEMDAADKILGVGGSVLPAFPSLQPQGSAVQNFGGMRQPPTAAQEIIQQAGLPQESTPEFQMKKERVTAQNQVSDTQAGLNRLKQVREKQIIDAYPLDKEYKRIRNAVAYSRNINIKANTELTKLLTSFTPEQLQQKLEQGAAAIGQTQARTAQIYTDMLLAAKKADPNSPQELQTRLQRNRSDTETSRTNWRTTVKELNQQEVLYKALPSMIASAEQGIFPQSAGAPPDPAQREVFKANYLAQLNGMLNQTRNTVNQLSGLAVKQQETLTRLEKERIDLTARKNEALNMKPHIPARPKVKGSEKFGSYYQTEEGQRQLRDSRNPPAVVQPPKAGAQGLAKVTPPPGVRKPQKAIKDMNRAELEAFIAARKKKR
jgi:hypothetical protein